MELRKPQRSTFDLSHEKRLSTRMGKLTPILMSECIPGDSFRGSTEVLLKLAPMIAPIFHRLNLYVHYFFVPNRLLWKDWETFITGGRLGQEANPASAPVPPFYTIGYLTGLNQDLLDTGSLADYLGVPPIPDANTALWSTRSLDAMPFAAFYRCWYDYYRDRNYTADNTVLPLTSGSQDGVGNYGIANTRYRAWEHDYFTSALPWTQRGNEVLMPIQGTGSVTYLPFSEFENQSSGNPGAGNITTPGGDPAVMQVGGAGQSLRVVNIDEVNITNSEISINDLRRAVRLQEWLERNALAGSRYRESIRAHYGVWTSDARLQRAEYIGGGKAVVQISEVMTTAYSEDASSEVIPPANPSGRGSVYSDTNRFRYRCEEHGFIVGVLSVMPTSAYMQGLPRMFQQRNTFLDYPWPSFAQLGEQEVYEYELYMDPATVSPLRSSQVAFGYQSRYSDWKHIGSSSHGDFRSTLDMWHLTRKFASTPLIGSAFVTFEDELQDRIFNVSGVDTLWMYAYNKLTVNRALPYFGTPRL